MAKKAMYRSWFKREAPRHTISGMLLPALALAAACLSTGAASSQPPPPTNEAERLFEPIRSVLQHHAARTVTLRATVLCSSTPANCTRRT